MARGNNRHDDRDDSRDFTGDRAYDDNGGYERSYGADEYYTGADERALAPLAESAELPAPYARQDAVAPVIIPGTGLSMGEPFIKRRERPLTMRLAMITLTVCILVTGLFAVTTLGGSDASGLSSLQALSGSIVLQKSVGYTWYVAKSGDTIESVAAQFHVQIGGIFEINDMFAGQELQLGQKYKIPDDPFYGKTFQPQQQQISGTRATARTGGTPLPAVRLRARGVRRISAACSASTWSRLTPTPTGCAAIRGTTTASICRVRGASRWWPRRTARSSSPDGRTRASATPSRSTTATASRRSTATTSSSS